ncbi:helix-turn-helix domain-containing protein [Prosthecomicrobium pneumaticum]|uniref:DNA-binding XRE family transcriptional regulator n=1 Tax=Prosthecomicrobium pneumaticum TaxID=81895 RepID=A0A7W9CTU8_9HYPH|nr:helix-turn-helix transcriptional regulator [Prosthecomicrobium pneumaticum]MBB5751793.1 DNA-binding XRE family transcriptional regulator [Prosthecomicrobium pneumaticum]
MTVQIIISPAGERLVVIPEGEYERLVEAAEDLADLRAVREFEKRLAAGDEELVSSETVDRLLRGENRIRVWRESRGLAAGALAKAAGITQAYLSQLEAGKRDGSVDVLKRIALALRLSLGDIA